MFKKLKISTPSNKQNKQQEAFFNPLIPKL